MSEFTIEANADTCDVETLNDAFRNTQANSVLGIDASCDENEESNIEVGDGVTQQFDDVDVSGLDPVPCSDYGGAGCSSDNEDKPEYETNSMVAYSKDAGDNDIYGEAVYDPVAKKVDIDFDCGACDGDTPANTETIDLLYTSCEETLFKIAIRFPNIVITPGTEIESAYLRLFASSTRSGGSISFSVDGEKSLNPGQISNKADYDGRVRTDAIKTWDAIPAQVSNQAQTSPDITEIIQEIINQGGWASGNAIVLFLEDNGSTGNPFDEENREYWMQSGAYSPVLQINLGEFESVITDTPSDELTIEKPTRTHTGVVKPERDQTEVIWPER